MTAMPMIRWVISLGSWFHPTAFVDTQSTCSTHLFSGALHSPEQCEPGVHSVSCVNWVYKKSTSCSGKPCEWRVLSSSGTRKAGHLLRSRYSNCVINRRATGRVSSC